MKFSIRGVQVLALTASLFSADLALAQSQQSPRPATKKSGPTGPSSAYPNSKSPSAAKRPSTIGNTVRPNPSPATSPTSRPAPSSSTASEPKHSTPPSASRSTETAKANSPNIRTALEYQPMQADIEIDQPTSAEIDKCTIAVAEDLAQGSGWTVRDAAGQMIRNFIDTNGDKYVDQWCYYKDGVEVYRDIDTNFNGKPDQYRWLNASGSRWGIDRDEDGQIDSWKMISAEEVTAEFVAALRERDPARFQRLLLTQDELDGLGAGSELTGDLSKKIAGASKRFREMMASQSAVGADTKWLYFGGSRPGAVPAGAGRGANDLLVYENVAAMIETAGKPNQVMIGALVRVGDNWRLVDAPPEGAESAVFFHAGQGQKVAQGAAPGDPSAGERKLLERVAEIEKKITETSEPREQGRLVAEQTEALEELTKIASTSQARYGYLRQMIDTLAANAQSGVYPKGVDRLRDLAEALADRPEDTELAAHAMYSAMLSDYTGSISQQDADYEKIQKKWIADLEDYLHKYAKSPDRIEALLQLAQAHEFTGADEKALKAYKELAMVGGDTPQQKRAKGACTRLESIGSSIVLSGKDVSGRKVDLNDPAYRNKVVLIHYWDSKSDICKRDIPLLKDVLERFGSNGFAVIGVSVDNNAQDLRDYLSDKRVPWPQLYEEGGLDNRLATEMGILTLPTMILIDKQGKVADRAVHAEELDNRLSEILKPRVANKKKEAR